MATSHHLDVGEEECIPYTSMAVAASSSATSPTENMPFPSTFNSGRTGNENHQPFPRQGLASIDPNSTLGQFSFAPATQTTVVTTTTTTTTKFPPFVMRAPRRMQDLDPKLYPLASIPTPASLRNIRFDLAGKPTLFREAEDTSVALEQLREEQETLRTSNGAVQTVQSFEPHFDIDLPNLSYPFVPPLAVRERPVSPESITEPGNSIVPPHSKTRSRPNLASTRGINDKRRMQGPAKAFRHLRNLRDSNPDMPETEGRELRRTRRRIAQTQSPGLDRVDGSPLSPTAEQDVPLTIETRLSVPPNHRPPTLRNIHTSLASRQSHNNVESPTPVFSDSTLRNSIVPTPPIEGDEGEILSRTQSRRHPSSIPSRLNVVDNSSGQDGSLPSPSLSPVTAAANLLSTSYFADDDTNSELTSQQDFDPLNNGIHFDGTPSQSRFASPAAFQAETGAMQQFYGRRLAPSSINDIPAMLDFFEAIPDELKSYVMHQLLRRCPKPTLHVVADAVNPALKCDFLGVLPLELSLNILQYLDVHSLCRASQVSKKWRHIVNGDEKAWKELFDADGFILPEGELQKSIVEGWGWQDPFGPNGFEQDISALGNGKSETDETASNPFHHATAQKSASTAGGRRPKRKAATKLSSRNKQSKRKGASRAVSEQVESIDWMSQMSTAEGPYNAANAATIAVPYSQIGLPSLKGLHLYKSLYRRHYLIQRNWMREDAKPRHIAFRAHDRHVVTCLQFDTDKILTGSDDNNINVYHTKTGALQAKLKGHEGGVWALQYDGNMLVSGSTDRSVRVWDIEKGRQTHVFRGHTSTVRCLQILSPTKVGETAEGKPIMMPKQPLILTGSRDSSLRVWRLPESSDPTYFQADTPQADTDCPYFVRVLLGHSHSVRAIAAHADTLVSGSYDCTVRVWKISTGETRHRLQGHTQKVYSVVLDHARNRCISGSMDNLVKIWSLDTGSVLHNLDGHSSLVGLLDLNCERLVSAAADSTLRIWDPENGQCKATLSAHTGAITCFQHDSQKVVSGSDRTLKMWNIKTGECIKDLLQGLSGVWQVKFNERRCVAAVQRDSMTYVEVLDFGAARDGVLESKRGRRIVVDSDGVEISSDEACYMDAEEPSAEA